MHVWSSENGNVCQPYHFSIPLKVEIFFEIWQHYSRQASTMTTKSQEIWQRKQNKSNESRAIGVWPSKICNNSFWHWDVWWVGQIKSACCSFDRRFWLLFVYFISSKNEQRLLHPQAIQFFFANCRLTSSWTKTNEKKANNFFGPQFHFMLSVFDEYFRSILKR